MYASYATWKTLATINLGRNKQLPVTFKKVTSKYMYLIEQVDANVSEALTAVAFAFSAGFLAKLTTWWHMSTEIPLEHRDTSILSNSAANITAIQLEDFHLRPEHGRPMETREGCSAKGDMWNSKTPNVSERKFVSKNNICKELKRRKAMVRHKGTKHLKLKGSSHKNPSQTSKLRKEPLAAIAARIGWCRARQPRDSKLQSLDFLGYFLNEKTLESTRATSSN